MAFSVALHLDRRSQNKDGSYKIILQIIVNRKNTSIATEYSVHEKDWDAKNRRIRNSSQIADNISRINNILGKKRTQIMDKMTALHDEGLLDALSIKDIRARLISDNSITLFCTFTTQIIRDLIASGRIGNARVYEHTLKSVKAFTNEKDFPFPQLNYAWLKKYEQFYFSKSENSVNGFAVYARTIRAIYNRAIKEKVAKLEDYPFRDFRVKKEATAKRALREHDIEAIKNYEGDQTKRVVLAKDIFLTSFYLIGISFSDIAHLKLSDVHDGRISYKRKKTGQLLNIKIMPPLKVILDKYTAGKTSNDYIFPIIKRNDAAGQYSDIKNSMKRHNKALKVIAEDCGIDESITSYWSRHSWATIAKRKGVSTAVISESMGHTTEKTTQIYLDSFEDEVIDAANALVTG